MMFYINTLPKQDKFRVVVLGHDEDCDFIYATHFNTEGDANESKTKIPDGYEHLGVYKLAYIPSTRNQYDYEYRGFHITMLENKKCPFGVEFAVVDQNGDSPVYHGNHYTLDIALDYIDRLL